MELHNQLLQKEQEKQLLTGSNDQQLQALFTQLQRKDELLKEKSVEIEQLEQQHQQRQSDLNAQIDQLHADKQVLQSQASEMQATASELKETFQQKMAEQDSLVQGLQ